MNALTKALSPKFNLIKLSNVREYQRVTKRNRTVNDQRLKIAIQYEHTFHQSKLFSTTWDTCDFYFGANQALIFCFFTLIDYYIIHSEITSLNVWIISLLKVVKMNKDFMLKITKKFYHTLIYHINHANTFKMRIPKFVIVNMKISEYHRRISIKLMLLCLHTLKLIFDLISFIHINIHYNYELLDQRIWVGVGSQSLSH